MLKEIKVVAIQQTGTACPSQWVGLTEDGQTLYIRYRNGCLMVGLGANLDEAVSNDIFFLDRDMPFDGFITLNEVSQLTGMDLKGRGSDSL